MRKAMTVAAHVLIAAGASAAAGQSPFATRVVEYVPAPGQRVNDGQFNDPARALGAPAGGGVLAPDLSKCVTLGGFGGSITLGFDAPVPNLPPTLGNPGGLDLIIYGNAFWHGGDPSRRWAEPGVIEVSVDANGNGLADDPWYLVRGSHLGAGAARVARVWDAGAVPPTWVPPGRSGTWTVTAWRLDAGVFAPNGVPVLPGDGQSEPAHGYADCSPTLVLGDLDGDGMSDAPAMAPEWFYTKPDDPAAAGVTPGSGGGDAIDLSDAVDQGGAPVVLGAIDFVRITTAVDAAGILGEVSTEVGGAAMVRPALAADLATAGSADPFAGPDGFITGDDFDVFIAAFFGELRDQRQRLIADVATPGIPGWTPDGFLTGDDFDLFVFAFFSGQ